MSFVDPLTGRAVQATFEDGTPRTSRYQGWCAKHGVVWLYDGETFQPKVNGGCGMCIRESKSPRFTTCIIHGIEKRGEGGRCGRCEALGLPAVADCLPALDEIDDDPSGVLPPDGVAEGGGGES